MSAQAIRKQARRVYLRTSIFLFGNHVGFGVNLLYALYAATFRAVSALRGATGRDFPPSVLRATDEFRARGYTPVAPFLPRHDLTILQTKLDRLFAIPDKVVHTLQDGGLTRLRDCLIELPELEAFLRAPEVAGILHNHYGGEFKLFNADVYRTVGRDPEQAKQVVSSLLWHFDNLPRAMVKLMVYLRDTRKETGALTLIPKETSTRLRKRGFWDRRHIDRFGQELNQAAVNIEGKAGTVILFSTHHCIHKATLPEKDYRDVAVFLVLPALAPQRPLDEAAKRAYAQNFGCCINPFTNKPAYSGDERA